MNITFIQPNQAVTQTNLKYPFGHDTEKLPDRNRKGLRVHKFIDPGLYWNCLFFDGTLNFGYP